MKLNIIKFWAKWICFVCIMPLLYVSSFAQQRNYIVRHINEVIIIDGELNEKSWDEAQVSSNFIQQWPKDSLPSEDRTTIRLVSDDEYLYLGAECYLNEGEKFQANTLYRDFNALQNDSFIFLIDTYADGLNGFSFEVTPFGSQGERLISNGGVDDSDSDYNWDTKWFSDVHRTENKWTVEIAIPLKVLRFKSNTIPWKINFIRNNRSANRRSSWSPIPVNINIVNLKYLGILQWEQFPKSSSFNYSVIPSITTILSKDYIIEDSKWKSEVTPSLDLKFSLGSTLNLDVTANPDFSQIEVDQQQLNLGRFELLFPEKRQFFLVNSDLFSNFGNDDVRPFFSRRIGIDTKLNGDFVAIPIIAGIRMSGKAGSKSRIGIMDVQTDKASFLDESLDSTLAIKSKNHFVATYQHQLFERSTASLLVINSQSFDYDSKNEYNRTIGGQFEWISKNNLWSGNSFVFQNIQKLSNDLSYGISLNHSAQNFGLFSSFTHIGNEFNPEIGFVPRPDINRIGFAPFYIFRPSNPKITNIDVFFDTNHTLSTEFKFLDSNILTGTFIGFSDTSSLLLALNNNYTFLIEDFDPSFSGSIPLPALSEYFYSSIRLRYRTDQKRFLSGSLELEYGKYFNGEKLTITSIANIRWQPYLEFTIDTVFNNIVLDEPYGENQIFLIKPQAKVSLNKSLFVTYISQYNSLQKNISSNLRLQWRFRPASDLFVVYSDNYTENFITQNRGISLKLIYWI